MNTSILINVSSTSVVLALVAGRQDCTTSAATLSTEQRMFSAAFKSEVLLTTTVIVASQMLFSPTAKHKLA